MKTVSKKAMTLAATVSAGLVALALVGCGGPGGSSSEPWSMGSDCGSCHSAQLGSMEQPTAAGQVSMHAAYDCTMCHADEAALAASHEGATASAAGQAAADEARDTVDCRSCHDRKELAERTEDALMKADGKSSANPHSNHVAVDMTCTDCHNVHEPSVLTCNECHDFVLPDAWTSPAA